MGKNNVEAGAEYEEEEKDEKGGKGSQQREEVGGRTQQRLLVTGSELGKEKKAKKEGVEMHKD